MNRSAVIFGIKGYRLTNKEKQFFKVAKPWGIILFSRNIKNISQLKLLINEIKKILRDKDYPILIDQEGGYVSRLNKIIDLGFFSQRFFGKLYNKDKKLFYTVYKIYIDKVCEILKKVGININTVPVLDVIRKNTHTFIGDRSFSQNSKDVSKLGNVCINLYKKNKIATVVKHIPGHGMSKYDSHFKTPIIKINKEELMKKDFKPFKMCKSLFAMTAHVVYSIYDPDNTATHSKIIINDIIRKKMNFNGLIMTDDISMNALKFDLKKNVIKALDAGCNLILHCNGNYFEAKQISKIVPFCDDFVSHKTKQFYKLLN